MLFQVQAVPGSVCIMIPTLMMMMLSYALRNPTTSTYLSIKKSLGEVFTLTKDSKIPLGLKRIMGETFQCKLCKEVPIKPPLIIGKCCKVILGCESCVNGYYTGLDALTKPCPHCRAPRGYNETMVFRGFDDFLECIKNALSDSSSSLTD